jgi:hypothetical protein
MHDQVQNHRHAAGASPIARAKHFSHLALHAAISAFVELSVRWIAIKQRAAAHTTSQDQVLSSQVLSRHRQSSRTFSQETLAVHAHKYTLCRMFCAASVQQSMHACHA